MKFSLHVSLLCGLFASVLFASPSVQTMLGQMVMVGFEGQESAQLTPVVKAVKEGQIGGVLLLGRNIASSTQLKSLTHALQSRASVPLLIAVDQEGGKVARLNATNGFEASPSAKEVAMDMSLEAASALYKNMAKELKAHGINYNLAPVVDLENPNSPIIGKIGRSFSPYATTTSVYAQAFVDAFMRENVATSLKHFPGHGSAMSDSHLVLTDVTQTWSFEELRPYYDFIQLGKAQSIMVAHVYLRRFDPDFPASLSKILVHDLLRERMGFKGVVISDDLLMKGVSHTFSFEERIIHSINAGVDILIVSDFYMENVPVPERIRSIVTEALSRGEIELQAIEEAYTRILAFKKSLQPQ
ncbi:MAG: glycoside hydrolase family 3 protein [Campylobacterales bacterium]|nr:glycoside hydrolase family 3 protein [Campylobacterales bacterium]